MSFESQYATVAIRPYLAPFSHNTFVTERRTVRQTIIVPQTPTARSQHSCSASKSANK